MSKTKERQRILLLPSQIVRKWETFRVSYMCFLTPPPPPPLLREETGISLQIPSDTGSDGRAAPPRSRLLRKQGEKEAQIHKAQSPAQCSWWSTSPHSCRNPKPLTPHCPLWSVLLPHGKAMLTCRYKNVSFALLFFISTPKCRSTHTLASSGYSQFYISLHKSFQLISNSKIKKLKASCSPEMLLLPTQVDVLKR